MPYFFKKFRNIIELLISLIFKLFLYSLNSTNKSNMNIKRNRKRKYNGWVKNIPPNNIPLITKILKFSCWINVFKNIILKVVAIIDGTAKVNLYIKELNDKSVVNIRRISIFFLKILDAIL